MNAYYAGLVIAFAGFLLAWIATCLCCYERAPHVIALDPEDEGI